MTDRQFEIPMLRCHNAFLCALISLLVVPWGAINMSTVHNPATVMHRGKAN